MLRFCRSRCVAALLAGLLVASSVLAAAPLPYVYRSPGLALGSPGAQSGSAIARDGGWLAIGMPGYDLSEMAAAGMLAIYLWREGRWRLERFVHLNHLGAGITAQPNARFGASVALAGEHLLIGCPGCESPRPKAYLVERPPR